MARCNLCGNDYDKCFEVTSAGRKYVFDCFECAIHALAPVCASCGCRVIGHGVEADGAYYCCRHCAGESGLTGLQEERAQLDGARA